MLLLRVIGFGYGGDKTGAIGSFILVPLAHPREKLPRAASNRYIVTAKKEEIESERRRRKIKGRR